jgi:hypothetical protein
MTRLYIRALMCISLVAFCLRIAQGQVTSAGSIAGQVVDVSGAMIPQASVTAIQAKTNVQWNTVTDGTGAYIFPNLPVGSYTVSAKKEGFSIEQVNSIVLNAGDELRTNITLRPGATTETVQVTSESVQVDTESGNVGDVVGEKEIQSIPLVERNFIQLVELAPGVSSDIGSEPGYGSLSSLTVSVNGVRNNANNWTIDGVPNLDVFNGNNAITPDMDALAEFRIDRGNYTAEQGRSAGATVNAILKAGTNDFHGSAFEFFRNTDLDANLFFNKDSANPATWTPRPTEDYNNFGYTVGGPIKKDKLFFFWSQEFRRQITPAGSFPVRVPTDQEKNNGNFSDFASVGMNEPLVTNALASNPLCVGCVAGQPLPHDTIPAGIISTNAQLLLQHYYPEAGTYNPTTGANFISSASNTTNVREELIRMDYNLSDKWKVFAHYVQDQNHLINPYGLFGGNSLPNIAASTEFEPMQSFAIDAVESITPNLVNEVEFGIFHNIIRITVTPALYRSAAPGLDIPYYFASHPASDDRIPALSFAGATYPGITTTWPFLNGFFYHKWTDNLSWHRNSHNLRFGLLVTQQGKNEDNAPSGTNGSFSFEGTQYDGVHTDNDLADMLSNFADTYGEDMTNPTQHLRYWDVEAYAQDQWQATRRLNLTYGLRYTYFGPEIDQNNLLTNFLPQLYSPGLAPTVSSVNGNLTNIPLSQLSNGVYLPNNAIISAGVNSPWGEAVFNNRKLNLAPRIGFSLDLFGNGKTALRGGYGMYYDRTAPYELYAKANPPFNAVVTLHDVTVQDPAHSGGAPVNSAVGLFAMDPNYRIPYNQQWSLGIQQEVPRNTVVDVAYVGTEGTHLLYLSQINQNPLSLQVSSACGSSAYPTCTPINVDSVRPYLGYGQIEGVFPESYANYNALQASLKEQIGSQFTLGGDYTYSKVMTDSSGDLNPPEDSHNPKAERGPASFDRTHILVVDYVWNLPTLRAANAITRAIAGGWTWSSLATVRSGEPVTVALGVYGNAGEYDYTSQRPNQIGNPHTSSGIHDWINAGAFVTPPPATFGDASQGNVRLPRNTQVDSSLSKEFQLYERFHAAFQFEAINVFNHTEFNSVDATTGDVTFGYLNGTNFPRVAQVGIHLTF